VWKLRVIIADDRADGRYALRVLLQLARELQTDVVGEAVEAHDLAHQLEALQPDVLLLDWNLPGLSDDRVLQRFRRLSPATQILVLSNHPELRPQVLAAGADAFISRLDSVELLIAAIRHTRSALHASVS
jgi:DNA-binding NarL/FixJ family response regulator